MVHSILHHLQPQRHIIHQRQVQDYRADESTKHDRTLHYAIDHLVVGGVVLQLVENQHHQCHLEQVGQYGVQTELHALCMDNLYFPLESQYVLPLYEIFLKMINFWL